MDINRMHHPSNREFSRKGRPSHLRRKQRSEDIAAMASVRKDRALRLRPEYAETKFKRLLPSPVPPSLSTRDTDRAAQYGYPPFSQSAPGCRRLASVAEMSQLRRSHDQIGPQTRLRYPKSEPTGQITTLSRRLPCKELVSLRFHKSVYASETRPSTNLGHRMRCCLYFSAMMTGSETSQKSTLSSIEVACVQRWKCSIILMRMTAVIPRAAPTAFPSGTVDASKFVR
ncbi:UNVERIFIED_ORG: hypothetical protein GGI57_004688 [Rhizobium aethiopicum]